MSMPKYPERLNPPSRRQLTNDLIESLALEELAIAHFINAEAEKVQAFTGPYGGFPTAPSNKQIIEFQNHVAKIFESITENQKLRNRTLELAKELIKEDEEDGEIDDE